MIGSRRLVQHRSACAASLRASDQLTRRRGDAEERERSARTAGWTGLHPSLEAGIARAAAGTNEGQCVRESVIPRDPGARRREKSSPIASSVETRHAVPRH